MTIFPKMLVLLFMNVLALSYLVYRLTRIGNSVAKAFQIAWNFIVARSSHAEYSIDAEIGWVSLLSKTWWLMLLFYLVFWLVFQEWYFGAALILLIVLHCGWYWVGHRNEHGFDRVFHLNSGWGIIYKTVAADSELKAKSLAELDLRKKNLLVLAIERNRQLSAFPKGTEILNDGDRMIIFGDLNTSEAILN
jgi:hypothetical protein